MASPLDLTTDEKAPSSNISSISDLSLLHAPKRQGSEKRQKSPQKSENRIRKIKHRISQTLRLSFVKDDVDGFRELREKDDSSPPSPSPYPVEQNGEPDKLPLQRVVSDISNIKIKELTNGIQRSRKISMEEHGAISNFDIKSRKHSAPPTPVSPFGRLDTYEKLEPLGEGSYATVFKGISRVNQKVVALKEIRLQEEEGTPFTAIREASLLKELKHANIVTLHDIIHTKNTLMFVFEYLQTDLSQYLEKCPRGIHPENVKLFLLQLLRGLKYCHARRILHRDIKPQNLLINEVGELKLADFGLARAKSVPSRTYSHEVVTLWYRPPDVLMGSKDYSTSLDMWGVGCIFLEMVTGQALFPGIKDTVDQLIKIWKLLGTPTEDTWPGVTRYPGYVADAFLDFPRQRIGNVIPSLADIPFAEDLAANLLQLEPKNRISADDCLKHSYFHDLPREVFCLPDTMPIFKVLSLALVKEPRD